LYRRIGKKCVEQGEDAELFFSDAREISGEGVGGVLLGGLWGIFAVGVEAVVKEDDVVAGGVLEEFFGEELGRRGMGVVGSDGPADDGEAEFFGGGGEGARFEAHGGTEEEGGMAGDVGDDFLGGFELVGPVGAVAVDAEVVVVEGVVAKGVARVVDAAKKGGVGLGMVADDEEGSFGVVGREGVEDAGSDFGVGAVVEGEGDSIALGDAAEDGGEELAAGREDGVGPEGGGGKSAGGEGGEGEGEDGGCVRHKFGGVS
jgi:hypothetical protein